MEQELQGKVLQEAEQSLIKQWFVAMLLTNQAYSLFELFKNNAAIIRT